MPVAFGTITAALTALIGDQPGKVMCDVVFTPTLDHDYIIVDGEIYGLRPAYGVFVDGQLVNPITLDPLKLAATDQGEHTGWAWHVDFRATVNGEFIGIQSFDFAVPSGSTVNLATVVPVPGGDGQYYIIPDFDVLSTTTLPAGSDATVTLTQTGSTYSFEFGIPRGANGGGGGGGGGVSSVNDVLPDGDGNVTLAPADIGAQPAGSYVSDTELAEAIATATSDLVTNEALTAALLGYAPLTGGRIAASLMPLDPNTYGAAKSADLDNVFAIATAATATANAAIPTATKAVPNGVATLDGTGKIPQAQLPAVAIMDWLGNVNSQAAMLALTGEKGDWATRTDLGTDWQIIGNDPTQLSSWREHTTPGSPVQSVAGRTGAITLTTADLTDAQTPGKNLLTAATQAAARSAIGAGTSSVAIGTTAGTAADAAAVATGLAGKEPSVAGGTSAQYYRGDKTWAPLNAAAISDATATGQALMKAATPDAARQAMQIFLLSSTDPLPTPSGTSPVIAIRARA